MPLSGDLCLSCAGQLTRILMPEEPEVLLEASSGARYRLDERVQLGEGTFGQVFRAHLEGSGVPVAIKVLKAKESGESSQTAWRFQREMEALLELKHPGIVRLHARSHDAAAHAWLAMDLVSGSSLSQWVQDRNPGRRDRLEVFALVCDAIQYAHEMLVLHRDIKPGNILIDESAATPSPRIIDFGLAKFTGSAATALELTLDGQTLGTPMYMAPELAESGGKASSTKSDLYALGVVLYELLSGECPFERLPPGELMAVVRKQPPRSLREAAPQVPRDLAAIVEKAMARDPSDRYRSAGGMADDVRRYLGGLPVQARDRTWLYSSVKFARRNWRPLATAALVFLSLTGAGLWHLHKMQERTAVASAAYREARNQMGWIVFQGAQMLREVGRSDGISELLTPAESFPWDLPVDDGDQANPAWEAGLIKARIQSLNGDIRLAQSDPASAAMCYEAAEKLARAAADDPAAPRNAKGFWFEYRATRLQARAKAGIATADEIRTGLEECRDFPADRWENADLARPQTAAGLLADGLPVLAEKDPALAERWHAEVRQWVTAGLDPEKRDVAALRLRALLATAAARLPSADPAGRWEEAVSAWKEARQTFPRNAAFGTGEILACAEGIRQAAADGNLDRAIALWRPALTELEALRENFVFDCGPAADEGLFRTAADLATRLNDSRRFAEAREIAALLPSLWASMNHNQSPGRVIDGKLPDLWPVLADGQLAEARACVGVGELPRAWAGFFAVSNLLGDLSRMFPAEKTHWLLLRCQVHLEWAAVPPKPEAAETPEVILDFALKLLGSAVPKDDLQRQEGERLRGLLTQVRASLPEKP